MHQASSDKAQIKRKFKVLYNTKILEGDIVTSFFEKTTHLVHLIRTATTLEVTGQQEAAT